MKSNTLRHKRVLITGASGFIGSHLTKRLLAERSEVHVFVKKDEDLFRIRGVADDIALWYGDLTNSRSVRQCIRNSKPEIIFHLASLRNTNRDLGLLVRMFDTNVKGLITLLQSIDDEGIELERFINTGTCEEYGDGPVPFNEDQKEVPVSPYSASKVAATYLCQMTHKIAGLPIVTVRPFLTFGPFQDIDMFIPSLIYHCLVQKDFPMTGGDQTREFNYIDDIVEGYMRASVCSDVIGEIINLGNGNEYKVKDVAEKIVNISGASIRLLMGCLPKRPGETSHFYCSNMKAKMLLDWEPKVTLDDGLSKTIDWFEHNLSLYHSVSS